MIVCLQQQFALCCELNTSLANTILAREPQRYTVSSQQWWKQMAKSSENTGALRDKREQEKRQATQEDRERMTLCISCIKNVLRVKKTGVED